MQVPTQAAPGARAQVIIVGSGFAGICMAVQLRRMGLTFLVLERASEIGGTWRDNTYPGCSCDVPSHLYSFSFEPYSDWSRVYPTQPELLAYLKRCIDKYRLRDAILFDTEAREATFDETDKLWRVHTQNGEIFAANFIVLAMGALSRPATPKIPGIDRFQGKTFHSACWDHAYNLSGKNVAVVGTGASAIQFIPKIAPQVGRLAIFQRTPSWILPKFDFALPKWLRLIFKFLPGSMRALRWLLYCYHETCGIGLWNPKLYKPLEWLTRRHITQMFTDPRLREALSPNYTMGCKRILIANDYFETLLLENVELVTTQIAEIGEHHILTQDRRQRQFDAIIFATGFRATDLLSPLRLVGRNNVELAEAWCSGPTAFYGMTIAGFPNLFMLAGPNSLLAHNSILFMIERQVHYVCESLRWVIENGAPAIELRREVQERFNQKLQERMVGTAWLSGCSSWYLDGRGENVSLWPRSSVSFWRQTRRFVPDDYRLCA